MTICSVCGRELGAGDEICPACGHPVEAKESSTSEMSVANMSGNGAESEAAPEQHNGTSSDAARSDAASADAHAGIVGRLSVRPISPINGGRGREFALDGRPIYIGRSPSCDIVLDGDQLTSRRHALLRYDPTGYVLVDLGSSNGTYVNDTEVREATPLHDGDRIVVGEHELLYSTSAASPEASLPGFEQGPVPPQPPAETNPSLVAVSPMAAAESSVPFAVATVDYGESNGANPGASDEAEPATQEYPAVHPGAWPSEEPAGEEEQATEQEAPATMEEPEDVAAPSAQAVAPASGLTDTSSQGEDVDLEAMHAQLAQLTAASEMLARRMEEQGRLGERRKAAIQEARGQVEALLAQLDQASRSEEESAPRDLNQLIDVTRQAAENPQHLQYLTRLAEHAGEIAQALEQQQQQPATPATPESIRQALEALRDQLASLG